MLGTKTSDVEIVTNEGRGLMLIAWRWSHDFYKLFVIIKHHRKHPEQFACSAGCMCFPVADWCCIPLQEMAVVRKRALEAEYQQIREMLQRDEREALDSLDKDLESGITKLNALMKKFNQNIDKMSSTRAEINNLLAKSHSLDFLQVSTWEHWPREFWEKLTWWL